MIVGTWSRCRWAPSFGLSVLIWQHLGIQLYWIVLAHGHHHPAGGGPDYNLLVISRFKEEIGAGFEHRADPHHGGHRFGGHRRRSGLRIHHVRLRRRDLRVLAQIGTTIGVGLIFDTLIVRSFMTPSIAAKLGRWFWWPLKVRRAASTICGLTAPSPSVRTLLETPP